MVSIMENKKTILYVVRYPLYEGFHLKQKFDGQLNAFRQLGFHAIYIGFDKASFYLIDGNDKAVIGKTRFSIPNYFHTFVYIDLYKAAMKVVQDKKVDVVYYRMAPAFKTSYSMAKCFRNNHCKFVLEIPTYTPEVKETDLSFARKMFRSYSEIWGKKMEPLPSLYVFMGDGNLTSFHGVPAIRIENGIDPDLMPTRKPVNEQDTIHILALSSMNYWHGYDRLIKSLAEYKGTISVIIHLVGNDDGGCLAHWKELAQENSLNSNVIFHGPLFGEKLNRIFDLCDIGVNSMGMYRKGFEDTSELKTREYISRGLPFISSVYDVVLDGLDKDLWYQITNDDSIPSMEGIVGFALRIKSDPTAKDRLHAHAIETMTWKAQYKKVFEKLEGVN